MGRHKANTKRMNVMLSEENDRLARSSHGGVSKAVNLGLELLLEYNVSVYQIKHRVKKIAFIGIFLDQRVFDVHYHYVNDLGSNRLGSLIRKEGLGAFDFKVIGKFKTMKDAVFIKKIFRKVNEKKGYDQTILGLDDSEI